MLRSLVLSTLIIGLISRVCSGSEFAAKPADAQKSQAGQSLFSVQPKIVPNPIRRAPLVAIANFETTKPVAVSIEVSDGTHQWRQNHDTAASHHRIAIVGMRPDRVHQIQIHLLGTDHETLETSAPYEFRTPKLPADFPPIKTTVAKASHMEPGVTLFPVTTWIDDKKAMAYGYLVAVDEDGEVVWFLNTGSRMNDVRVLKNGHLLYIHASFRYLLEVDLCGNVIRQWHASTTTQSPRRQSIPVYVDSIHHDVVELPNGELLTLATELCRSESFPRSVTDQAAGLGPAYLVCDKLVSFRPDNGWISESVSMYDRLDSKQFGYLSRLDFWTDHYDHRIVGQTCDWSHANGIAYDATDDTVIVSIRHLDCLMKLGRTDGQIHWMLGDPTGWGESWQKHFLEPAGELDWPHHQHAPQITSRGTLMLYDNGNFRAKPYAPKTLAAQNYSRVVEFQIDEKKHQVQQVWEYRGEDDETFYCPFYGEADLLPNTGNILVTDGGHVESTTGIPQDVIPSHRQWARVFEIRDAKHQHEKVFEIVLDSGIGSRFGWSIYRSIRLPTLQDLSCRVMPF
ncbi:aryl-sulfate sulfotransferase [Thalassoroseus pseudoceratinae]|uniref:aryl-sulfate sulfotransferase n=1 Tax=Thalassoroseus pseudoceratinae TaxID=2713176 RepID=UPI001421974C|nr:aryl-sulfate sulfotransferase [Thalassoroseus pseudoceratinae]